MAHFGPIILAWHGTTLDIKSYYWFVKRCLRLPCSDWVLTKGKIWHRKLADYLKCSNHFCQISKGQSLKIVHDVHDLHNMYIWYIPVIPFLNMRDENQLIISIPFHSIRFDSIRFQSGSVESNSAWLSPFSPVRHIPVCDMPSNGIIGFTFPFLRSTLLYSTLLCSVLLSSGWIFLMPRAMGFIRTIVSPAMSHTMLNHIVTWWDMTWHIMRNSQSTIQPISSFESSSLHSHPIQFSPVLRLFPCISCKILNADPWLIWWPYYTKTEQIR